MLSAMLLAVKLACAKLGSGHLLWQSGPSKGGPKLSCCWGCLQIIFCGIGESSQGTSVSAVDLILQAFDMHSCSRKR